MGGFRIFKAATPGLIGGALLVAGCQGGYPIPASQCDEWCDAEQASFCTQPYDPAACVLDCHRRGGDASQCHAELETLLTVVRSKSAAELQQACDERVHGLVPSWAELEYEYESCAVPYSENFDGRYDWWQL